jgi:hypothetical protein
MIKNGSYWALSFWWACSPSLSGTTCWFSRVRRAAPEIVLTEKAKAAKQCVMSTDYMRTDHMHLLDIWRLKVVREGQGMFVNHEGNAFE